MARLTASLAFTLLKGGLVLLTSRLSTTVWPTVSILICGTAAFTWSAIVLVPSPGKVMSRRPAWSAAYFVPRSTMTT